MLDESCRKYTTINTIGCLFQFKRMPFGIARVSAIFQCTIELVIRRVLHMVVRANDIPMSGIIDEKNLKMSRDYEHVWNAWTCKRN